jgi:hypothetical protein
LDDGNVDASEEGRRRGRWGQEAFGLGAGDRGGAQDAIGDEAALGLPTLRRTFRAGSKAAIRDDAEDALPDDDLGAAAALSDGLHQRFRSRARACSTVSCLGFDGSKKNGLVGENVPRAFFCAYFDVPPLVA